MKSYRKKVIIWGIIGIILCFILSLMLNPRIEEGKELLARRWDTESEDYKEIKKNVDVLEGAQIAAKIGVGLSVIGIIVMLIQNARTSPDEDLVQCPGCRKLISPYATSCPGCGRLTGRSQTRYFGKPTVGWKCSCGNVNPVQVASCVCGKMKPVSGAGAEQEKKKIVKWWSCGTCGSENPPGANHCTCCGSVRVRSEGSDTVD